MPLGLGSQGHARQQSISKSLSLLPACNEASGRVKCSNMLSSWVERIDEEVFPNIID